MLRVKRTVAPSPEQWEAVIDGMRLPFKSGYKKDSHLIELDIRSFSDTHLYDNNERVDSVSLNINDFIAGNECLQRYYIGKKDLNLMLGLCKRGDASHRKLLRQLPVIMEIEAPLYWWKQCDQYKVGTVTNAESTMHCLTKIPFRLSDFSVEHYQKITQEDAEEFYNYYLDEDGKEYKLHWFPGLWGNEDEITIKEFFEDQVIGLLNALRYAYSETKDKKYWHALNELLPHSYLQTRMWSANYETCLAIVRNRIDHDLDEWRSLIIEMFKNLPLLYQIAKELKYVWENDGYVEYYDEREKINKRLCPIDDIPSQDET